MYPLKENHISIIFQHNHFPVKYIFDATFEIYNTHVLHVCHAYPQQSLHTLLNFVVEKELFSFQKVFQPSKLMKRCTDLFLYLKQLLNAQINQTRINNYRVQSLNY